MGRCLNSVDSLSKLILDPIPILKTLNEIAFFLHKGDGASCDVCLDTKYM